MHKTIFVVDDNAINLTMAEKALLNQYWVIALPSAAKMFKALERFQPDLILLDVEMPEMNGLEAIVKLKEHPEWSSIPVIFTTGLKDEKLLPNGLKLGALDVINKPFVPSTLQNCIMNYACESYQAGDKVKNRILIIDDQVTGITTLTKILSPEYIIYTAENGRDGINAAEKYVPDVILLDILMMEMDGYAVITELKNSDATKDIPVIFITSLSGDEDEEKGLALGAVDYITKPFSPATVKLRIRNQIKMLEQLHIIERLSLLDQLTDLPNRRSFEIRLSAEWGRAIREQTPISVLVVDIDKFKNYNDTYGHQQGDIALQEVAKIFTEVLKRPGDFSARWGGEEFIVLLPNTDLSGALDVAEQIRECAQNMKIPIPNRPSAKITISIGVNTQKPGHSGTKDELISGADMALYNAKNRGRNRVCCFEMKHGSNIYAKDCFCG